MCAASDDHILFSDAADDADNGFAVTEEAKIVVE